MHSYLTEPEWREVFTRFGGRGLAYGNVSQTQYSPARRSGGCTINDQHFLYLPDTDELIRSDVFKWVEKCRADARIAQRQAEEAAARAAQQLLLL